MAGSTKAERGPFRSHQLRPGDRYELSDGHAIYAAPTGGDGARANLVGASVLDTDPAVEEAGVHAGYSSDEHNLRALDVAVGNVPNRPGWIAGAPPLAVEYAGRGQDERELQQKITELLAQGTRHVWVVRLTGPRRVEVYEPGSPVRTAASGERLSAPGTLRNEVEVDALFDREAAHEATLRNLLQRRGYASLDQVREQGVVQGRRATLLELLEVRFGAPTAEVVERVQGAPAERIGAWSRRLMTATTLEEVFD